MKTFVCNILIMKIGKYLQYDLWKNENVCNMQIMRTGNDFFAIHEIWKKNSKQIKKIGKYLFAIHELWERENICLQYMNYENMEMSVCNTWIMKIFVCYTFTKTWQ